MTGLPADRAWSTWDPRFPACLVHLPSRFAVRVTAFSATENRHDPLPAERQLDLELGEHDAASSGYIGLRARVAGGTLIGIEFALGDGDGFCGRVRILEPHEMLFRLAVLVEAGFLAPAGPDPREPALRMVRGGGDTRFGPGGRALALERDPAADWRMATDVRARCGETRFHLAVAPVPALSAQYVRPADVADTLEHRGWLHHPPPAPGGDWVALRFYGDPRLEVTFAAACRDAAPAASATCPERGIAADARARLGDASATIDAAAARAVHAGTPAAGAIRDVMAWNTVYDDANRRPYTACSRAWLRGFGGWGVWMSDAFYNALLCARAGDAFMARANLEAVLAQQQPAGNIPCLAAAEETWIDRTQLPVAAFLTWRVFGLTGDAELLAWAYPALCRQLEWIVAERDGNANGLFEYGSSPVGDAQGAGTRQGALNESGMDNLAVFDEAVFVEQAHTIDLEEPGHNSLIALESEALSWIARELGLDEQADAHLARARALAVRISAQLWDPAREIFAARHWDGRFAAHVSPTSFFPLVAGAATPAQTEALVARLCDPAAFWGELPLPSAPYDDPVSREDVYWRGRIWPPHLYWTWEGLRRAGQTELATELARRAWTMFETEWIERRHCHENFHARDPARHETHDSDPFYSWGALIPFMWESERDDPGSWAGIDWPGAV